MRKTKIVCTLGPSTDDEAVLRELILSGMNVARLNMSHGTHEEQKRRADMVKKLRKELDVPVAILLDTKGPEIRTGKFAEKVMLTHGQKYTLTTNERPGDAEGCSITFKDLPKDVHRGSHILIDDGLIEMVVEKVTDTDIECRLLNDGPITSYKGINVPGVTLSMPYISEKDRADLEFCVKEDFEFIAASFTRSAEDIVMIRNELEKNNCRDIRIIAKIENTDGVENIDDIIRVSDGIMVARGDLGVEIPMEEIPVLQKQLTRHTENSYKLVGALQQKPKPTAKQLAAVALLGGGPRTLNELEDKGISRAVLDNLCAKGVLECSKVNKSIDLYSSIPLKNEPICLTAEQQAAYDALLPKLEDDAPHSALLYGVTGSGKTLVFLKLIAHCLEQGRKALVLVPEISLTPQMILRLKSQFGRRVAVQHSALNHTERLLQWQMIQDGGADIVVGTRSAIFSPLENIGLVIIDEEQEHTYRSESAPRYSAHEVARQRAAENGALLLLASATPSTESFYAARNGRTQLVRLTQRYGGNPLPNGEPNYMWQDFLTREQFATVLFRYAKALGIA